MVPPPQETEQVPPLPQLDQMAGWMCGGSVCGTLALLVTSVGSAFVLSRPSELVGPLMRAAMKRD